MPDDIEGIYAAYMTGKDSGGFAMFVIRRGKLVGADPLGVLFDGTYDVKPDGGGYDGRVSVKVPSGGTTVQGVTSGPDGLAYDVQLALPKSFAEQEFVRIDTPLGPVNAKFKKLRALDD